LGVLIYGLIFNVDKTLGDEQPQSASDDDPPADHTGYMETESPKNPRFITSTTRLTACTIPHDTDIRQMGMLYPQYSREHHEEGKVVMQFTLDADRCVRKATILQSSGYYRLDKASLDFAMNIKFPPATIKNITTFDDGRPTFTFPMVWKLVAPTPTPPHVPGDPCANGAICVDEAPPPPKAEEYGTSPDPSYIWMPGYYSHYPKTGYEWNEGQWSEPKQGYHWIAAHWERFKSKWLFVGGHWDPDK